MIPDLPPQLVAALSDAPLALMLLWVMVVLRRDLAARDQPSAPAPPAHDGREELAAFKLEVARTYVPLSLIRDLDTRLTQQLGRLEEKLDEVSRAATAAAAVSGHALPPRRIGYGIHASEGES
jgi:hypothetical protein